MGYVNDHDLGLEISKRIVFEHDFREQEQVILDLIPDKSNVLDFGCYNGTFNRLGVVEMGSKLIKIDGFDIDPENKKAVYHAFGDIFRKYDITLASHVFEHISENDLKMVMAELSKISDKLIISMPNTDNIFYNFWLNCEHKQPYDNPDIFAWLHDAGWNVQKVVRATAFHKDVKPLQNMFRFAVNVLAQKSPFYNYMIVCEKSA